MIQFFINQRGALEVDRQSMHDSPQYKAQIEALRKLTLDMQRCGENATQSDENTTD